MNAWTLELIGGNPVVRQVLRFGAEQWARTGEVAWFMREYANLREGAANWDKAGIMIEQRADKELIANEWGYYPPHPCDRCGNVLRGMGSGYPAELYAGAYTGLCYPCTERPPEVVRTKELDGAIFTSYAPAQPSYRRDREVYIGYPDCARCGGAGHLPWGANGPRNPCPDCASRYESHPLRKRFSDLSLEVYRLTLERHTARMRREAGVAAGTSWEAEQRIIMKNLTGEQIAEITRESWEWYEAQRRKLYEAAERRGTFR